MKRLCRDCYGTGELAVDRAALGPVTDPATGELLLAAGTGGAFTVIERCWRCGGHGWIMPPAADPA